MSAELIGADTASELAIRWLTALVVLCGDPLAIALTVATSARTVPFDSRRADAIERHSA